MYSLSLPAHVRTSDAPSEEGGHDPNTTNHIVFGVGGGVSPVTPLPTDVLVDHDAFRWGKDLLGASVMVLQVLSTTTPQSVKALARRLGVQPSTVRHHLKRLRSLGLLVQDHDGVRLDPSWQESLDVVALSAGVSGRQNRERAALLELRRHRWEVRRRYARQQGVPLRKASALVHRAGQPWTWVDSTSEEGPGT